MACKHPPIRDEEFYFEDGSCILQVGNRLFNLHRSILSINSPFFKQMFSLPQQICDQSGQSDEDPIVCDDAVDDFRALCRILYHLLTDPEPEPGTLDAPAILGIARVASLAHKYEFSGIQNRAYKIMSGSSLDSKTFLLDEVAFLLQVALECSWEGISPSLKDNLLLSLSRDRDRTSLETASKLGLILNIAEQYNDISLQAEAYHHYLISIKWALNCTGPQKNPLSAQAINEIPTSCYSLSVLNDAQKIRLFRGFANLSAAKARLRVPPIFSHSPTKCIAVGLKDRCEKAILKIWEQKIHLFCEDMEPTQILAWMPELLKFRNKGECLLECVEALNHEMAELKVKLELALPEYFGLKENMAESTSKLD